MISAVSGYYGKLPVSAEFLRLRAAGPEIRWLDDWLQRGVLYAKAKEGQQWTALTAASSLWNFLLIPADHGRLVSGVIVASQDKAGRSFPFLSFLVLNREPLAEQVWLTPLVVAGYLEATRTAVQALRQGGEWHVFQQQAEDWNTPLLSIESAEQLFDQYLRETPATVWLNGLGGERDGGVEDHEAWALEQVVNRLNHLQGGQSGAALQLPLPAQSQHHGIGMAFWLAACLPGKASVQRPGPGSVSFWRQNATAGESSALISLGPGVPNVVRALVSPEAEDDSWRQLLPSERSQADSGLDQESESPRCRIDPTSSLKTVLAVLRGEL